MNNSDNNLIPLELTEELQKEEVVISFLANKKTKCIAVELNHVYDKKTLVSSVYQDWIKTLTTFSTQASKKGLELRHITMLEDALDNNYQKVMECIFSTNDDKEALALDLTKSKIVDLFVDEVKTPYAAIRVSEHIGTMPINGRKFEDWIGSVYYYYMKETRGSNSVLSQEGIGKIQSVLRFEANNSSKPSDENRFSSSSLLQSIKNIKTLHLRVAASINYEENNLKNNAIYYDLCNPQWEIVEVTRVGWDVVQHNEKNILFKRFSIMNSQVYPEKDYPADILDKFMKLTNIYDEDNKLLAEVYLVSL
jgi:hypothetical protein